MKVGDRGSGNIDWGDSPSIWIRGLEGVLQLPGDHTQTSWESQFKGTGEEN